MSFAPLDSLDTTRADQNPSGSTTLPRPVAPDEEIRGGISLPPLRLRPSIVPVPVWLDGSRRLCAHHRVPGRLVTALRSDAYCDACTAELAAHDAAACYSLEALLQEYTDAGSLDDAGVVLERAREVGRYGGATPDYGRERCWCWDEEERTHPEHCADCGGTAWVPAGTAARAGKEALQRVEALAAWLGSVRPIDCRIEITAACTWVEVRWATLLELGTPRLAGPADELWGEVEVAPGIVAWAEAAGAQGAAGVTP